VETLAGGAGQGKADGSGSQATFDRPIAVALDRAGTSLYVVDAGNGLIRRIALDDKAAAVTTLPKGWLRSPAGVVVGVDGRGAETLYVSDDKQHLVFAIPTAHPDRQELLAGTPPDDAAYPVREGARAHRFDRPGALALTAEGHLLVADVGNQRVSRVPTADPSEAKAETRAGLGPVPRPDGVLELETGVTLVTDSDQGLIWGIQDGKVAPYAGSTAGSAACADGRGPQVRFNRPMGVLAAADGRVLVADTGNGRIREIRGNGDTRTLAGGGGAAAIAIRPLFLAEDGQGGVVFTNDQDGTLGVLGKDGRIARMAGLPRSDAEARGPVVDGDARNTARFASPLGIARDSEGTLYVTDGHCIRRIRAGQVDTWAGHPEIPGDLDLRGGDARFREPVGLAWRNGHLYVADAGNHVIRRVAADGQVETAAGRMGDAGAQDGAEGHARLNRPFALAFSPGGLLYVTEAGQPGLRRIAPDRSIRTLVPGTDLVTRAGNLRRADGTVGLEPARLGRGYGIACTALGDLLVVTRPNDDASGGVVQITAPEEEPKS
jgi:DNA-binding beta-propeller fold protein YncE